MRRLQRGSAFVVSLAVLAGLVAVLASLAAGQKAALRAQANRQDSAKARLAAQSGINRALAALSILAQDAGATTTAPGQNASVLTGATTLQDEWAQLGQNGDENFIVGDASFRIQIIDASSRININTATQEQLERLPLTQEQIESLLDFRTENRDARPFGGKDEFYNNLFEPYNTKLRNFETLDELLQVRGFTALTLYEPITDVQTSNPAPTDLNGNPLPLSEMLTALSYAQYNNPEGGAKLNINSLQGEARLQRLTQLGISPQNVILLASRPTWGSINELCQAVGVNAQDLRIILDNLATDSQPRKLGRINLNTASEAVLLTLPGITPDVAASIVQRQQQGFATLGEVATLPGMTGGILSQCADLLAVRSSTFIVRVAGRAGNSQSFLEATIDLADQRAYVRQVSSSPYQDPLLQWNWQPDTMIETVLKERS